LGPIVICRVPAPDATLAFGYLSKGLVMKVTITRAAGALLACPILLAAFAGCGQHASKNGATVTRTRSAAVPRPTTSGSTATPGHGVSAQPGSARVVSSRVSYPWRWPNNVERPGRVLHDSVASVPDLVKISVGEHPTEPGQPPFDRMSFTFTTAFPSYQFAFADKLTGDPSGQTIPVNGLGILKIVFTRAQAHASGEARSTIVSQPARNVGFQRIVDYAQSGDFEGVLSYGVGVTHPVVRSNPQILVRAYEVETVAPNGQYLYVVAIDIDTANHG
jgi:hypothetical protein